jgi:hypothetical protein
VPAGSEEEQVGDCDSDQGGGTCGAEAPQEVWEENDGQGAEGRGRREEFGEPQQGKASAELPGGERQRQDGGDAEHGAYESENEGNEPDGARSRGVFSARALSREQPLRHGEPECDGGAEREDEAHALGGRELEDGEIGGQVEDGQVKQDAEDDPSGDEEEAGVTPRRPPEQPGDQSEESGGADVAGPLSVVAVGGVGAIVFERGIAPPLGQE